MRRKMRAFTRGLISSVTGFMVKLKYFKNPESGMIINQSSLIHDGLKRNYLWYRPGKYSVSPMPLLIALHGRGGDGGSMILLTRNGLTRLAGIEKFIVVYPDGIEMNWNDGRNDHIPDDRAHIENIDDVGFISSLIDRMIAEHNADPSRVYVTGISNGAIMAYRLACELSEKITAIAPVDGNMPHSFVPSCNPLSPVSVIAINNTKDPLVPFYGGFIRTGLTKMNLGKVLSADDSIMFWVKVNNCKMILEEEVVKIDESRDGLKITRRTYANNETDAVVTSYTIHGGGHTWPGGAQYLPAIIIGKTCRDLDANEVIWSFLRMRSKILQESVHG